MHKSNAVSVLEKAHYRVYYTSHYHKTANMDLMSCSTSDQLYEHRHGSKLWKVAQKPTCVAWLKRNTDAFRIIAKELTITSYVYRDDNGRIVHSMNKRIGDILVLVAEATAVPEALRMTT